MVVSGLHKQCKMKGEDGRLHIPLPLLRIHHSTLSLFTCEK